MTINCKCNITKTLFNKDDFRIFACRLIEPNEKIQLNKYGGITLIGDISYLIEGNTYELNISPLEKQYNGETQYSVDSCPTMDGIDISNLSEDDDYELLKQITTDALAKKIHEVYPKYCQMILNGDDIDLNKIKGVKEYRHNVHVRRLNAQFKYYHIMREFPQYKLSANECKTIYNIYESTTGVIDAIKNNPYYILILLCGRAFPKVDSMIIGSDDKWVDSDIRCEYNMCYILQQNELAGNTYMNAIDMANAMVPNLVAKSKDVIMKSDILHFEEDMNIASLRSTYEHEMFIANSISDLAHDNIVLNWDCAQFNKTMDGNDLTSEQKNVLKTFCEHRLMILDSCAGSGKTSTMLALIQMCEANGYTYTLLAPTGKASKRISEATNRDAYTIHRATESGDGSLDTNVIIIDECSMLTIETMLMILNTISCPTARIVFIMDVEQLPPIGLGCVGRELLKSNKIPTCTLTKVFRFSSGGMIKTTTLARRGEYYLDTDSPKSPLLLGDEKDYEFIPFNGNVSQIIERYMTYINNGVSIDDVVVLTPRNVGEFGTYNINNIIQDYVNPIGQHEQTFKRRVNNMTVQFHKGDLVLVTKNNYDMIGWQDYEDAMFDKDISPDDLPKTAIFNGEIGRVLSFVDDAMKVAIDDKIIMFFKDDMNNLLLGYSTTIYKFQGSQIAYPIILTLNAHKNQLSKNLLYTCLSRGQKRVVEIGETSAIHYSLNNIALDDKHNRIADFIVERWE
jgi:exodeoxyribonuclease V alpha subunit